MHRLASVVGISLLVLSSSRLAFAEPEPPANVGKVLWITGLSVLGGAWFTTGVGTTISVTVAKARDETIAESWVPVAGPWIMLADSAGLDSGQKAALVVSGVVQTLGLAAVITGLAIQRPKPRAVALAPTLGGFVVFGTF